MKTLNAEELKAVALDILDRYPKAEKVSVTSDGMAFITDESENAVKTYAARNPFGKELDITKFSRTQLCGSKDADGVKYPTAADALKAIEVATTVEEIEAVKEAGKKWKTVVAAADEKIVTLKA